MSTSLAQRSKPAYLNPEIRTLSEQLEDARAREQKLRGAGIRTDEVRREILELRRKLRDGGQLRAGDMLSAQELRDAWPLLELDERCDGLRVLPQEDAEDFFIALSATDQVAILLHFRPGHRRQWMRLLEPDDIVDVLQEAGDEHRSTLFHLLNAPTRKEVAALLASAEADGIAAAADRSAELTPQAHLAPLDTGHSSSTRAEVAMGASRSHTTASTSEEGDGVRVPSTLALGRGELAPQPTKARKRSVVVGVVSTAVVAASLVVAVMVTRSSEPKFLLGERAHSDAAVSPETAIAAPPGAAPIAVSPPEAPPPGDAAVSADAAPDAAPAVQTFPVGLDCTGLCYGGSNGQKVTPNPNANYLCISHDFPRALDFTISSDRQGGKFCMYESVKGQSQRIRSTCDPSCVSCNPINSVTCSNP